METAAMAVAMPTEMLQTEGDDQEEGAPPPGPRALPPPRLLLPRHPHGPAPTPRRLSAVERLEADKAKYVKSQEVINARQEPVTVSTAPPPPSPSPQTPGLDPAPGPAPRRSNHNAQPEATAPQRANLNLEMLVNLLNGEGCCLGGPGEAGGGTRARSWAPQRSRSSELHRRSFAESLRVFPTTHAHNLNLSASLLQEQAPPPAHLLSLSSSDLRLPLRPRPARPGPAPRPSALPPGPPRPPLTRSKSDLSERYARAGADVERFFNYCGLDPGELQGRGLAEGLSHVNNDLVSLNLRSASVLSSEYERSLADERLTDEDSEERVPYGVSAVERNARVIKWLYSIKQARASHKVSHV